MQALTIDRQIVVLLIQKCSVVKIGSRRASSYKNLDHCGSATLNYRKN